MTEKPIFFSNQRYELFGMLHQAAARGSGTGFVLCSPFAEEKLWTHRVFVNFARLLSASGHAVLRFDFMGHGDSEGDFEDATLETRLSDIACAARELRRQAHGVERVGLIGLRFGAMLASAAAEESPDFSHLILWEPVINGADYMQEVLRTNLATQMAVYKEIRHNRLELVRMLDRGETVNVDGYEIGGPFYRQVCDVDLLAGPKRFAGRVLIVEVAFREAAFRKASLALREAYRMAELVQAVEQPFWKEIKAYYPRADNLFDVTTKWLSA